jgi:hypothetical protein
VVATPRDEACIAPTELACHVASKEFYETVEVCSARDKQHEGVRPFKYNIRVKGTDNVVMRALFDEGALIVGMSKDAYKKGKEALGELEESRRRLRMADGSVVKPKGVWRGRIEIGGIQIITEVEVFHGGGGVREEL